MLKITLGNQVTRYTNSSEFERRLAIKKLRTIKHGLEVLGEDASFQRAFDAMNDLTG
jgi:hypothetical protein